MIGVYAVSLAIGVVLLGWWIVGERTRGDSANASVIRRAISLLVAFGLGGLSASYAELHTGIAVFLALTAAIGMHLYSDMMSADADR